MLSVLNFRFTFLQKSMTFFLFLRNNLKEVKDERPSLLCMEVPDTACAVAYDRCHHHTLIFPICRTHQKHLSLVQNALVAGNLCCRKVDASSAIGALIGDTGQLLPYHRHAPSAQEQRHQHFKERHGRGWSSSRLHLHRVLRQRLRRQQRDGPRRAVGPLGGLWQVFLSIYLWLDVCPVFASLPLIRANWSCL